MLFWFEDGQDDIHEATGDVSEDELLDLPYDDAAMLWDIDDDILLTPASTDARAMHGPDFEISGVRFGETSQKTRNLMQTTRDR